MVLESSPLNSQKPLLLDTVRPNTLLEREREDQWAFSDNQDTDRAEH